MRRLAALLLMLTAAAPAREPIGVYYAWGAFREGGRCFASSEPPARRETPNRPFAAVTYAPALGLRGQLHVRLSRERREGSAVILRIDDQTFQLIAGASDAWAPDRRADGAIVAAMRGGVDMVVETRSAGGALVRDNYALRGAASAIDAAAPACARRR